ncbi:DNA polymerase I [Firmicutes bacterium M10-2]|nr:DNA polymerase I [Firmicutes bacterium M10-2]
MKKLLLIDGNSMLFRAYYATAYTNRMSTSSGIPTNAVFGFIVMMQKAIQLIEPDAILVAWDAGKPTFRHEAFENYKGTRKELDEDLILQMPIVREYLDEVHVPRYEQEGYEADDIIGTVAKETPEMDTVILTSDRDLLQLIDATTRVLLMKKGLSEMDLMDEKALKDAYDLTPNQIIDLKGLMGDASDNIPGVKGVGEKTALKLLHQYQSVEGVYEHIDEIKGKMKEKLENGKESAFLSKELATIYTDMEIPFSLADLSYQDHDANAFYQKYEMRSLLDQEEKAPARQYEYETISSLDEVPLPDTEDLFFLAVASDEPFLEQTLYGFMFPTRTKAYYLPLEAASKDAAFIRELNENKTLETWNAKMVMHLLDRYGFTVPTFVQDYHLASFLLYSQATNMDYLLEALHITLPENWKYLAKKTLGGYSEDRMVPEICSLSMQIEKKKLVILDELHQQDMADLYHEIELPLVSILYDMERTGINVNEEKLEQLRRQYQEKMDELMDRIYGYAGHSFNIDSPKQLGIVLFDELKLKTGKKRSTAADVLEKLKHAHPIIDDILEYKKYSKIMSTYIIGLARYIHGGKIYTTFNQTMTQTGRLSSSDPNLQNISIKDEEGKEIRKIFVAPKGYKLISADYSQIELRMLAHMANEYNMIDAFCHDIDIHTKTACELFGVQPDEVDAHMRRVAKTVNFGIVYGQTEFGLAQTLNISRQEAKEFMATYFESYPNIRQYMEKTIAFCEQNGYVETLMHRRRMIPEINDKNYMTKEFGKRAAMNAPIQGSAADLIKMAMIQMNKALTQQGFEAKMLLQIHDELILLVPDDEVDPIVKLVQDTMDHAMDLQVPLKASIEVGQNWYEAK